MMKTVTQCEDLLFPLQGEVAQGGHDLLAPCQVDFWWTVLRGWCQL